MKIVAVSDLHGDFNPLHRILDQEQPELLLCAGDWGKPEEVSEEAFRAILDRVATFTVFGNNDDLQRLANLQNSDGTPVLLENGEPRAMGELTLAGISGIRAKSHKKPWYITDEEVAAAARKVQGHKVAILITHECPIGMADLTPEGKHGGHRCFTEAFKIVQPRIHLCGHLHRQGTYQTRAGQAVINIGISGAGDYARLHFENSRVSYEATRL